MKCNHMLPRPAGSGLGTFCQNPNRSFAKAELSSKVRAQGLGGLLGQTDWQKKPLLDSPGFAFFFDSFLKQALQIRGISCNPCEQGEIS